MAKSSTGWSTSAMSNTACNDLDAKQKIKCPRWWVVMLDPLQSA
jgi:hypothetical protein